MPENAYTEPACEKYAVSFTNAQATKITPTVAKMNASGTARPISCAGSVPLSAIAAVGAMTAIDSAIASQKCSSRRSPARSSITATPFRPEEAAKVNARSGGAAPAARWRSAPPSRPSSAAARAVELGGPAEHVRAREHDRQPDDE